MVIMWEETTPVLKGAVIVATVDNKVLVVQYISLREIFLYNLDTGLWRKYVISASKPAPPVRSCTTSVAIGRDIFKFGGKNMRTRKCSNALWKLSLNRNSLYTWKNITVREQSQNPSPRFGSTVWEYEGKLWSYGGMGDSPDGYLNTHGEFYQARGRVFNSQLMCFDPANVQWTNVACSGDVPHPCTALRSVRINTKVWLYGVPLLTTNNEQLYEFDLLSLAWTCIQMGGTTPGVCIHFSFKVFDTKTICLHGGLYSSYQILDQMWLLDLPSKTWSRYHIQHARCFHTAMRCPCTDTILFIGGYTDRTSSASPVLQMPLGPHKVKRLESITLTYLDKHREEIAFNSLPRIFQEKLQLPGKQASAHERVWNKRLRSRKNLIK